MFIVLSKKKKKKEKKRGKKERRKYKSSNIYTPRVFQLNQILSVKTYRDICFQNLGSIHLLGQNSLLAELFSATQLHTDSMASHLFMTKEHHNDHCHSFSWLLIQKWLPDSPSTALTMRSCRNPRMKDASAELLISLVCTRVVSLTVAAEHSWTHIQLHKLAPIRGYPCCLWYHFPLHSIQAPNHASPYQLFLIRGNQCCHYWHLTASSQNVLLGLKQEFVVG